MGQTSLLKKEDIALCKLSTFSWFSDLKKTTLHHQLLLQGFLCKFITIPIHGYYIKKSMSYHNEMVYSSHELMQYAMQFILDFWANLRPLLLQSLFGRQKLSWIPWVSESFGKIQSTVHKVCHNTQHNKGYWPACPRLSRSIHQHHGKNLEHSSWTPKCIYSGGCQITC